MTAGTGSEPTAGSIPAGSGWSPACCYASASVIFPDRIVFERLIQVLRFGCSYEAIADSSCSATTIRTRRDEWIEAGIFARLKRTAVDAYDRIVGLVLEEVIVGEKAPIQASQRWPVERANAWHNAFNRLQRCYERREDVIDAFFDLADTIITVRSLIRQAWTTYRWDSRPARRP